MRREFPEPVILNENTSGYLDAIRALAAFAVMFGHWRGFYFVDYGHIESANLTPLVKSLYAVTAFGHQCVMVFFVLSGLFISSSIFRNVNRGTWSWRSYGIDRGVRLYVVLIPGLLLGLMWDLSGITFLNGSGIYSAPRVPFGDGIPINALTPGVFIGNLLFLQTRFTPVFGSNGPLWSLYSEFWYYALFPAMVGLVLAIGRRRVAAAIGPVLLGALALWVMNFQFVGYEVWLAGLAVALTTRYLAFANGRIAAVYTLCAGAVFGCCLWLSRGGTQWAGSDLWVGLSFAGLLHGILQLRIDVGTIARRLARKLAGFSYSLYVLHFPLMLFIAARLCPYTRWQPDRLHLFYGFCIGACVILYAFGVASLTEFRTAEVRRWIKGAIRA